MFLLFLLCPLWAQQKSLEYGNWHTIYVRMNRWSKNGVLDRIFTALQAEGIINIDVKVVCLDSTAVKVYPDACGALKKVETKQSGVHAADLLRKSIRLMLQHE